MLIAYVAAGLWTQVRYTSRLINDFDIYLGAGQKIMAGLDPYQPFEIGASFVYPPTALLLFGPLSTLSPITVHWLWATVTISAYLVTIVIVWKYALRGKLTIPSSWAIVLLLFFAPFWESVSIGQVNTLMLLGVALFLLGLLRHRFAWLGDISLGIVIAVKISPLVLVALPLVNRDWLRIFRIALSLAILIFLSLFIYGPTPWFSFVQFLPILMKGYPDPVNETIPPSAQWLLSQIAPEYQINPLVGRLISIIMLMIWVIVLLTRNTKTDPRLLLGFGITTMTLSSSLIWFHHLVFLVIPFLLVLWNNALFVPSARWLSLSGVIAMCLIQISRIIEKELHLPPFAAIAGYLFLYFVTAFFVMIPIAGTNGLSPRKPI